jgi:hypothetical protein
VKPGRWCVRRDMKGLLEGCKSESETGPTGKGTFPSELPGACWQKRRLAGALE